MRVTESTIWEFFSSDVFFGSSRTSSIRESRIFMVRWEKECSIPDWDSPPADFRDEGAERFPVFSARTAFFFRGFPRAVLEEAVLRGARFPEAFFLTDFRVLGDFGLS
jgi:hypothetical protein